MLPNLSRRKLLKVISIIAALPSLTVADAIASTHGNSGGAFNGGRSQLQSNFLGSGGDYPYRNLLKTSSSWKYLDNSGFPTPDQMTSNGYPISPVTNTGWFTSFTKPSQTSRAGNYYIVSTGSGTIAYQGGSFTAVSGVGNKLLILGSSIPNTAYNFYIQSTNGGTPLSFLAICHEDDIAGISSANLQTYLEANPFSPSFVSFVRSVKPAENRFLNWQNGNGTNETSWATRKPTTYWSYAADQMVNQRFDTFLNCYVGWLGTAGGGNNVYGLTDTSGSSAPKDKQWVTFTIPAAAVTCTSGANAQISWTAHGLVDGSPFLLFRTAAGSAPGGVSIASSGAVTFYAIFVDPNTIKFATTQANALAGIAITTSSTGSGLLAQATIVQKTTTTYSTPSSNLTFSEPHLFATGDSIGVDSDSNTPSNISSGGNYFAIASSSTVLQIASSLANALANVPIVFSGSFTGTAIVIKSPQINLNGTGNIPLKSNGGRPFNTASGISGATRPVARASAFTNCFGTAVYDIDLNCWLLDGCSDTSVIAGIMSGFPPEHGILLCKLLGCDAWFVSPRYSLSYNTGSGIGLTDYMTELMKYCRDNKPSWMKPTIEGYNEDWNFRQPGTNYGYLKSFTFWGSQNVNAYVGRYNSLLAQAANQIFGGAVGASYNYYVGVQGGTFATPANAAASDQRLLSAQFVASGPAPPAGYNQDPAYKWFTHAGGANYYLPSLYSTTSGALNETQMATDWVAGGSLMNDPLLAAYIDSSIDAVFTATIVGTTMTVTAIASGQIYTAAMATGLSFWINGAGIAKYAYSIVSGASGGTGSYTLSGSPGNGTYTLTCGRSLSLTGTVNLAQNYLAWALGTAQAGGKWGGVYQGKTKFYEGGYSPDLDAGVQTTSVRQFRWASKFQSDAGTLINGGALANGVVVNGQYNDLVSLGCERPSLFQLAGGNGAGNPGASSNIWSVMDPDRYISLPPQITAITAFNA